MNTNPNAVRILCYGDSYTWGYIPASDHVRFPADIRWTGVLQNTLGDKYEVIEEGLNSRTLNSDDERSGKEGRNGKMTLISCLDTHDPIDVVILMLGTNELKDSFDSNLGSISRAIENDYVKKILERRSQFKNSYPKLILVSPPMLNLEKEYAKKRYSNSQKTNKELAMIYEEIAARNGCYLVNSSEIVTVGEDGVHIDANNHKKLGKHFAIFISKQMKY